MNQTPELLQVSKLIFKAAEFLSRPSTHPTKAILEAIQYCGYNLPENCTFEALQADAERQFKEAFPELANHPPSHPTDKSLEEVKQLAFDTYHRLAALPILHTDPTCEIIEQSLLSYSASLRQQIEKLERALNTDTDKSISQAADFLLAIFENKKCDNDAVSDCIRCNVVALCKAAKETKKSPDFFKQQFHKSMSCSKELCKLLCLDGFEKWEQIILKVKELQSQITELSKDTLNNMHNGDPRYPRIIPRSLAETESERIQEQLDYEAEREHDKLGDDESYNRDDDSSFAQD